MTICHITHSKKHPAHTITVSSAAVAAHLRHGDHLGACTGTETRRAHGKAAHGKATRGHDASSHSHGHGNGHGHGNDHGHHK